MTVFLAMFAVFIVLCVLAQRLYGRAGGITPEGAKAGADAQNAALARAAAEASRSSSPHLGSW